LSISLGVEIADGRGMKRMALYLVMLLPIGSSLSGCSWIFVQPLPPRHESGDPNACTTNRAAPVIDTILTLTNVTSAVYVAGQENVTNKGPAVTAGLLVGAMWLSSAIYGYSKTSECEAALADDEPVRPRPHRWVPPPAVRYPAGPPAERPPAWDSPTVTPTPASPSVAPPPASGSQQRDNDDPGARARPAPTAPQQTDSE
jgi:hypothetical protein